MTNEQINHVLNTLSPIELIQAGAARLGWLIGIGQEEITEGLFLGTEKFFDLYLTPEVFDSLDILEHQVEGPASEAEVN